VTEKDREAMSEVTDTAPVLAPVVAFKKVNRGVRWTETLVQADPKGPAMKLPVKWLNQKVVQEIVAPSFMPFAKEAMGGGAQTGTEDQEVDRSVMQFRITRRCNRDLTEALIDKDMIEAEPGKVGATIKNLEALLADSEVELSPPESNNPDEDERARQEYERQRAENEIVTLTPQILSVLLEEAPDGLFQEKIVATRNSWEKAEAKKDAEGNGDSPTSAEA